VSILLALPIFYAVGFDFNGKKCWVWCVVRKKMGEFHLDQRDVQTFFASCALITIGFYAVKTVWADSRKKQAWFIMLVSSFVLTITGFIYASHAEINSFWNEEYLFGDDFISRTILIFFTSCNTMDLILGYFYYREFLFPLTTITHHIFFIIIVIGFLGFHNTRGFLLTFVFELPTFLLSIGTVWPHLRSDMAFGITFLFTRIGFHILTIYRLALLNLDGYAWKVLCFPFLMHMHWFYKWFGNYFLKSKDEKVKTGKSEKVD
jgi:hypothetical protein